MSKFEIGGESIKMSNFIGFTKIIMDSGKEYIYKKDITDTIKFLEGNDKEAYCSIGNGILIKPGHVSSMESILTEIKSDL